MRTISLPARVDIDQPHGRVRRLTVSPRGQAPVDALIAIPEDPQRLILHFIGFNQAMGPWEAAKLATWAAHAQAAIVACELPGFSRYGQPLSTKVRQDLLDGDPLSWGTLTLSYLQAAIDEAEIPAFDNSEVLAYSTGCSLAAAVLPAIQASFQVSSLTLVEPVTLAVRTIGRLAIHNAFDWLRLMQNSPRKYPKSWVRPVSYSQWKEPRLRYIFPDFLASVTMLAGDDTGVRLDELELPTTHLARGSASKLCNSEEFSALNERLASKKILGTTTTVTGFGHQFWHSLAAVDALARTIYP